METPTSLARIVQSVEALSNLSAPMVPDELACVLGLRVLEIPGARFALRIDQANDGGTITIDPCAPPVVRAALVARGCASYVLRRTGALRSTSLAIGQVAVALCNTPDPGGEDGEPRTMFVDDVRVA